MIIFLSLLSFAFPAKAAIISSGPKLLRRQDISTSSKYTYETLGYSSVGESDGSTIWAPFDYDARVYYTISSGNYFAWCTFDLDYSTRTDGTLVSYETFTRSRTDCPMFTSCDLGVEVGESTTYQCAGGGSMCGTRLFYSSYGASEAKTDIVCLTSTPGAPLVTSVFKERPPNIVPDISASVTTTPSSSPSPLTPGSTPIEPTPSSTSTPASDPSKPNNAGIIAGSVVGGVAVLALASVATLWVLKRNRSSATYYGGHYQPEKVNDVPEYNPHASSVAYSGVTGTGGSPHMGVHSPAEMYAGRLERAELSGVRSPVQL